MADEPRVNELGPPRHDGESRPSIHAVELDGLDGWQFIGRGGHGEVWAATERSLGRRVAVKILPRLAGAEARHRFRVESSAIGMLTGHPCILGVLRSGISNEGHGVIVMELADRSLADQLAADGPLPPDEVASIITKIASGLDAAHAAGVLHLDVKPANVLVSKFGQPKLADFGVASMTTPPMDATIDDLETWANGFTPGYCPPELLEGAQPSVATDVHLLAASAVALLSGHPPYARHGDTPADVWRRTIIAEPDLAGLGIPDDMIPALRAGLARDPSQRPATAGEFADLLSGRSLARPAVSPPVSEVVTLTTNMGGRGRAVIVFAAALLLVAGALTFAFDRRGDPTAGGIDGGSKSAELWVDAGLWGGIVRVDTDVPLLTAVVPGQDISRPVASDSGVWAVAAARGTGGAATVRQLDREDGSTLTSWDLDGTDARSTCQVMGGTEAWVTCNLDANRLLDDPAGRVRRPEVAIYLLAGQGPTRVDNRDGRLTSVSARDDVLWYILDDADPAAATAPTAGRLVVQIQADETRSVRLPVDSPAPEQVLATRQGMWLIDGRNAALVTATGPDLAITDTQTWNFTDADLGTFDLGVPVEHDGGIAFLARKSPGSALTAVHLRTDASPPESFVVPFPYESPGFGPELAVTESGNWWTLGSAGGGDSVWLLKLDPSTATITAEIRYPGRVGPFSDPAIAALRNEIVALLELPQSDISAVIINGDTGRERATIPIQQRSLLPLQGQDGQVVVADLWTKTIWSVDGQRATAAPAPAIPGAPVATPNGFAVVSRQRGGGSLHTWNGDASIGITVDGGLVTDGSTIWYENPDDVGTVEKSTGATMRVADGTGFVSIYRGTQSSIWASVVIDGVLWRLSSTGVEAVAPSGAVSPVELGADFSGTSVKESPSGLIAVLGGDGVSMINPSTKEPLSVSTFLKDEMIGYLVSDDISLWWVSADGGSVALLDPETGDVVFRYDDLGIGMATAAVSSGALIVAHEGSGTLTRVPADGGAPLVRDVGARPYWVSATDELVVIGLQGERAVAQFDSTELTERWRLPLGPAGPDR